MLAALIATMVPQAREWIETNPVSVVQVLAAVAIVLRFITHGKISLGWDVSNNGSGTSSLFLTLLCCTMLGLIGLSQTSCSSLSGVDGSVYYIDSNSGAKGGMTITDGKAKARFRLPIYNQDGQEVGRAEINATK